MSGFEVDTMPHTMPKEKVPIPPYLYSTKLCREQICNRQCHPSDVRDEIHTQIKIHFPNRFEAFGINANFSNY